ncbi:MAG: DUF5658 family protein [Desulfobacteraceae bacterium]|nr:DUF5658 family protein [Desulfobacteraceae bacterium]
MQKGEYACHRGRPLQVWCGECRHHRPERRRAERRRARRRFRWREGRSGFDNRRHPARPFLRREAVRALRDRPGLLLKILFLFNLYNLADYLLTARALAAGHREINPVMRALFAADPLLAGIFKVATGLAVTLLIWRFRRFRPVLRLSLLAFGLYLALLVYHLYGIFV